MVAFAVLLWSTLHAYFIRIEIKLEAEIAVSLLALHVLYTGDKKSVCILERPSPLKEQCHGDSVLFQKPKTIFGLTETVKQWSSFVINTTSEHPKLLISVSSHKLIPNLNGLHLKNVTLFHSLRSLSPVRLFRNSV